LIAKGLKLDRTVKTLHFSTDVEDSEVHIFSMLMLLILLPCWLIFLIFYFVLQHRE